MLAKSARLISQKVKNKKDIALNQKIEEARAKLLKQFHEKIEECAKEGYFGYQYSIELDFSTSSYMIPAYNLVRQDLEEQGYDVEYKREVHQIHYLIKW